MILSQVTRYRRPIFQVALAAADAMAVSLALTLAVLAHGRLVVTALDQAPEPADVRAFRLLMLSAIVVSVHAGMGLYEIRRGWDAMHLAMSAMVASVVASGLFLAGCYMVQDHSVSRLVMVTLMVQAAASTMFVRMAAGEIVRWSLRRGIGVKRVIVVGDNGLAVEIRRRIEQNPHAGLVLAGQAIPREAAPGTKSSLRGGSMNDVASEILRLSPHRVLFTVDIVDHEELQQLAEFCLAHDIEALQVPRLYQSYPGQVSVRELLGIPFLGLGNHGLDGWELVIKNGADRALAAAALVALSPLLAGLALAVRWSTGGPILHRSRRAGRGGVPFTLLIFETCRLEGGRRVATRVGSFMERYGLSGLPQLLNVLAGDMSFVGPNPDTPEGLKRLSGWQRSRLSVKPGITGLAQLNRHDSKADPTEMIQYDLAYIDTQSLLLDAQILVQKTGRVLGRTLRGGSRAAAGSPGFTRLPPAPSRVARALEAPRRSGP